MDKSSWSADRPPAWTGLPIGQTPQPAAPQPPVPEPASAGPAADAAAAESAIPRRPLRFADLLALTWQVFTLQRKPLVRAALRGGGVAIVMLIVAYVPLYSLLGEKFLNAAGQLSGTANQQLSGHELAVGLIGLGAIGLANLIAQCWLAVVSANATLGVARGKQRADAAHGWTGYLGTQLMIAGIMVVLAGPLLGLLLAGNASDSSMVLALLLALVTVAFFAWFALGTVQVLGIVLAEGRVGVSAIRRSLALARGARLRIFAPLFVVSLVAGLVAQTASSFASLVTSQNLVAAAVADAIAAGIGLAVTTPFTSIVITLTYISRRLELEAPADDVFKG